MFIYFFPTYFDEPSIGVYTALVIFLNYPTQSK